MNPHWSKTEDKPRSDPNEWSFDYHFVEGPFLLIFGFEPFKWFTIKCQNTSAYIVRKGKQAKFKYNLIS